MNQYEAMFLFDPTFGNSFEKCEAEIRRLMDRVQGEIIVCRKWDERRLAYRIKGRKRGVYVLVYFKAAPDRIVGLQRDAKLSENILRLLVLRADRLTRQDMESAFPSRGEEPAKTSGEPGKASEPAPEASETPESEEAVEITSEPVATETAVAEPPPDQEREIE